jgi:hypothetical protein
MMKQLALLLSALSLASCGVDKQYASVCTAIRAVKPDAQGYLPRDAVFQAAGISEANVIPYFNGLGRGTANLKGGGWLEFFEATANVPSADRELGTIDQVVTRPNRKIGQLGAVVVRDDKMNEVCRVMAPGSAP